MLSTFAVVTRPAMDEPLEMAKQAGKWSQIVPNRPKIVQNCLKLLKIASFLHLRLTTQDQTSTFTTFTRPQAGSTFNIVANICNEWRQYPTSTVAAFRSTFTQMLSDVSRERVGVGGADACKAVTGGCLWTLLTLVSLCAGVRLCFVVSLFYILTRLTDI